MKKCGLFGSESNAVFVCMFLQAPMRACPFCYFSCAKRTTDGVLWNASILWVNIRIRSLLSKLGQSEKKKNPFLETFCHCPSPPYSWVLSPRALSAIKVLKCFDSSILQKDCKQGKDVPEFASRLKFSPKIFEALLTRVKIRLKTSGFSLPKSGTETWIQVGIDSLSLFETSFWMIQLVLQT